MKLFSLGRIVLSVPNIYWLAVAIENYKILDVIPLCVSVLIWYPDGSRTSTGALGVERLPRRYYHGGQIELIIVVFLSEPIASKITEVLLKISIFTRRSTPHLNNNHYCLRYSSKCIDTVKTTPYNPFTFTSMQYFHFLTTHPVF